MTKDELIEKYRDINVDYDWCNSVYDEFKHNMNQIGIKVDNIYFSGFGSQGDGACFEGSVCDWGKFLPAVGYTDKVLIQHAMDHFSFSVKHSGHYYHENCTSSSTDMPNPDGETDEYFIEMYSPYADFRSQAWLAVLRRINYSSMEETFRDAFKDHMRDLYKDLETEYDYLTSDEVVWESLVANDMHITWRKVNVLPQMRREYRRAA